MATSGQRIELIKLYVAMLNQKDEE